MFFLLACSPAKKLTNSNRNMLKGSWTLTNVEYSNTKDKFKSILFGEADISCFIGSQWNFIENNNTGTYTLATNNTCSGATREIKWDVLNLDGTDHFQFKRLEADVKAKAITAGYRLQLSNATENSVKMIQPANSNGEAINLIYTFTKNNIKK